MKKFWFTLTLRAASVAALSPSFAADGGSAAPTAPAADPLLSSWQTKNSGQYARVVQTKGAKPTKTWPSPDLLNHGGGQDAPAYSDIQQVSYSPDWVYVKGTGLASHQMGPWYDGVDRIFGNWPANQNYIRRFPRHPKPTGEKTVNGLGSLGLWVNGVALFNLLNGFVYDPSRGRDAQYGPEVVASKTSAARWVRNAVLVEQPTFDASNAHQPGSGEYHYHDNPLGLRFQRGDNVTYDATANRYREAASAAHPAHHSPILGWSYDGYPIYGPYGYADPKNPSHDVRRMISGFVVRDGAHGTDDLRRIGRHSLAKWATVIHGVTTPVLATDEYGPDVSPRYPLSHYVEDFDFLGDRGAVQGRDFDLDVYNGRFCVTPEFPQGTYAYFVTLNADGSPAFPYVICRQYYGEATGGQGQNVVEKVTVFTNAGPNTKQVAATLRKVGGKAVVVFSSTEGGHYALETSPDGKTWTTLAAAVPGTGRATTYPLTAGIAAGAHTQYRATLLSLDAYDATGSSGRQRQRPGGGGDRRMPGGIVAEASPASATRGEVVTVRFTFGDNPPPPPSDIQPLSAKLGTLTARTVSWDGNTTTAMFALPAGMKAGAADVTVTFPAPPDQNADLVFVGKSLFTVR